ncbi:ADP-ribose pyrophosphatase YjhB (NUDIX family) [Vibrio crassostreae]|uniref:NUDIX hydrolase n=1 Tax=Vibrio TaxID=662 RepID=UPI000C8614E1|nr:MULTISPECIES: NUDIX domain-containing protein [Vibrio]NOH74289.1 NUDIX domain-containing protein [Vibrio crassostreae]PMI18495.1 DNA mismatch repair protein MutT [Vibrio sp. 10N.286.46.E10]PTO96689.1 DNA mismatch repair protein MutT [Vibrio sp. 10N.286.48.B8]PTP16345.1 DNA mismatch repair protein MutT [Vibrio sp. 10N.286.51.C3]PTQ06520.1 DNA mismatch repair protein MutT [Vibrio sp. ZF 223]
MEFTLDKFNGIIIAPATAPQDADTFHAELSEITEFSKQNNKGIIWISLPISLSHLIPVATELGFVFHNCLEDEITLIHKSEIVEFVPFIPTHTLGAGALITNGHNQVLMIKEHGMTGYKLPGGHIELGEGIEESVVRETLEETGIKAEFVSVVGMATRHPYQFGKSNLYFVCHLIAQTREIAIQDTDEIAEAKWVDIEEYINNPDSYPFNRQLVGSLIGKQGLELTQLEGNSGPNHKPEIFFSKS